jgi:hypothetical protein
MYLPLLLMAACQRLFFLFQQTPLQATTVHALGTMNMNAMQASDHSAPRPTSQAAVLNHNLACPFITGSGM